ncbi:VPS35 endosomal protein sorting factor-like isoform X2 [Jatropha curcas]|uniref:VPS35 endosomal protein sorting factor-like isoform X2 n=1 Tax=Jatropha curcas TaxID=180498 RepID=UPI0005FB3C5B|nr:VPS35 endosomal protein sorting factor-like isoform X2 [Jatropha curcas]
MEFRPRDYNAEQEAHAIPRSRADHHPLLTPSPSSSPQNQVIVTNLQDNDFFDPLRGGDAKTEETPDTENSSSASLSSEATSQIPSKEWTSFKRFLMQKFPVSKMISVSSMPDVIIKSSKAFDKSSKSTHVEEVNDSQKIPEDDAKVITQQEYVSRLHELKDEIMHAWQAEDRVTALRLSIKVAKLLMDTSVQQFYPTLFVLVTDVMDMLGGMVWQRIRQKAEFSEDGSFLGTLPENFKASDICSDAKETCHNWFCKVGSIRELLPRIYLELAILPCWRFLLDRPVDNLQRLVMMTRGIADPLASSYCRLYMAHCARKLSAYDKGYLVTCVNDIKILLIHLSTAKEAPHGPFAGKIRLLVSLIEPTIEYIMKCIFADVSQRQIDSLLMELRLGRNQANLSESFSSASIVLHHLLKELPTEVISSNAVDILHLIKCSDDSSFDQCLNYRLLGFRLGESRYEMDTINSVVDEVIQVIIQYGKLEEYLKVVDAYMDIVLQNQMDSYLNMLLEGIYTRACNKEILEDEQGSLQSIFLKLLSHFKDLDIVFSLKHFLHILDVMHGSSRNVIDMHILNMATRNGRINDPTTIQLLFEIAQSLYDGIDFANMKDDEKQQPARLISRFVQMVDFGVAMEQHLTFLVECRGAFRSINELKETLVHSSNYLATKALKDGKKHLNFVKSCIAFAEVTIPSISAQVRQLNLYLETAEVALLSGLIPHSDGLIVSAMSCLENVDFTDGTRTAIDIDGILSSIRKICSLLVMVPGNADQGVTKIPSSILSLIYSRSWMTPRITSRIFCAIILLLATLSQKKLPYHLGNSEILGSDWLFFGDSSYVHELVSLSERVLHNLVNAIEQEPSKAARGSMALEACNCIALSFKVSHEISQVCWKLIETARICLSANDKYLQSTLKYLDEQLPSSKATPSLAI